MTLVICSFKIYINTNCFIFPELVIFYGPFEFRISLFTSILLCIIISIPDEELFFRNGSLGALFHTLSKSYDVTVGYVNPYHLLRLCIALFAVAEE